MGRLALVRAELPVREVEHPHNLIVRAFQVDDFKSILENIAGKLVQAGWEEVDNTTYQKWTGEVSVKDFKDQAFLDLSNIDKLEKTNKRNNQKGENVR